MESEAAPVRRLYVVDDDPHVLAALRFTFEADGRDVCTIGTGEDLLVQLGDERAACIIIDQRLPGLSGLETIARLRASGNITPAVLITSHPSRAIREIARKLGVDIVEKPLTGDGLARRVSDISVL